MKTGRFSFRCLMNTTSPLHRQLDFIMELDKLKAVQRRSRVRADDNRFENSAEHSWHISLMAMVLADYAEEPIDLNRVVKMLLLHDVVEIDAGDTFAFDTEASAQQEVLEIKAAKRLFGILPDEQRDEMLALWLEFEKAETSDGRFAKAMDRMLPLLQNCRNEGGSWAEHGISRAQVLKRNEYLEGLAPGLWQYAVEQIDQATENGWLKP